MSRSAVSILLSCLPLLGACVGTETGNPPVVGFGNSGCKTLGGNTKQLPTAQGVVTDPLYSGLHCFVWERVSPTQLKIDVTNYASGCGAEAGWKPRAELDDDGSLSLVLEDDDCAIAGCFSCLYDVSFTVELPADSRDREVRFYEQGCEGTPRPRRATLSLASEDSGAACTYTDRAALASRGGRSGPRMLCGSVFGQESVACDPGLVCSDIRANQGICLESCQQDDDCDSLSVCQDGLCRLGTPALNTYEARRAETTP
jgi:hypothetical protein